MKKKRRCIFIEDVTWNAIAQAAKKDGRSAANWIRMALQAAVSR